MGVSHAQHALSRVCGRHVIKCVASTHKREVCLLVFMFIRAAQLPRTPRFGKLNDCAHRQSPDALYAWVPPFKPPLPAPPSPRVRCRKAFVT